MQNFDLIDDKRSHGETLKLQSPLAPDALELIVVEQEK